MRRCFLIIVLLLLSAPAHALFPRGGGTAAAVGNYPAKSIAYIGCSNTQDTAVGYAAASARHVLWNPADTSYNTNNGFIGAWEKDDGTQVPGTGSLATPPNSIIANFYTFWTAFDLSRRTNNPVGGQQLLGVWIELCDNENDTAHGTAPSTNSMLDTVIGAMLKKHTTDCLATPSLCGESVAPNIADAAHFKVFVSPMNTYKPQGVCFLMNTGGVGGKNGSNDLTNGTISAGATQVTFTAVTAMTVGGPGGQFSWVLDNGTEVLQTIVAITGLVVDFTPAIPASRSVVSGTRAYPGDGAGLSTTVALMQHAIAAAYAGFASINYGLNGEGQGTTYYPSIAAADGHYYPLGPLNVATSPSNLQGDGCHPSLSSGQSLLGVQLANFLDAQ